MTELMAEIYTGIDNGLLTAEEVEALARMGQRVRDEHARLREMFVTMSDADFGELLYEEATRIECAGAETFAEYRALNRAGSRFPLGGMQKKRIFEWLAGE